MSQREQGRQRLRRRVGTMVALGALLAAGSLVMGGGAAHASRCGLLPTGPNTDVGVDTTSPRTGAWVCLRPTNDPNTWHDVFVGATDQFPTSVGATVGVTLCNFFVCGELVEPIGAEIGTPVVMPASGTQVGGDVIAGPNTCVYANSVFPTCISGLPIVGAVVETGDGPQVVNGPGPCIGVLSTCVSPPFYVLVGGDGDPTVTATVAGTPLSPVDVPRVCVLQVGAVCP